MEKKRTGRIKDMTIKDLLGRQDLTLISQGDTSLEITKVFCCDLLSVAMAKAPAGCAWVTVMSNVNTLAVASLTEAACVVLAEGTVPEGAVTEKASSEGITVLASEEPVFDTALAIYRQLEAG